MSPYMEGPSAVADEMEMHARNGGTVLPGLLRPDVLWLIAAAIRYCEHMERMVDLDTDGLGDDDATSGVAGAALIGNELGLAYQKARGNLLPRPSSPGAPGSA